MSFVNYDIKYPKRSDRQTVIDTIRKNSSDARRSVHRSKKASQPTKNVTDGPSETPFHDWMHKHFYTIILWIIVVTVGFVVFFFGRLAYEYKTRTSGVTVYESKGHFYKFYPYSQKSYHYSDCPCKTDKAHSKRKPVHPEEGVW